MSRIEEAGNLFGNLLGHDADEEVDYAFMHWQCETIEICHELTGKADSETVREWIVPRRDILLAEVTRRGIDQSEDAQCAIRKIEAVLSWIDRWPS